MKLPQELRCALRATLARPAFSGLVARAPRADPITAPGHEWNGSGRMGK